MARAGQYEWVVDPIDGTVNLFYGIPHYAVSIACRLDGRTLAGVIYDPNRDELFASHAGGGSTLNGQSIHVAKRTDLKEAILALGFSKGKPPSGNAWTFTITMGRRFASFGRWVPPPWIWLMWPRAAWTLISNRG